MRAEGDAECHDEDSVRVVKGSLVYGCVSFARQA